MNLFYSHNRDIEKAYVIRLRDHEKSEQYAAQCVRSLEQVGMPYELWDAFDGIGDPNIGVPSHSTNSDIIKIVKLLNKDMTKSEIACVLSHISLWTHCAKIDQPIVVLEHDAVMLKKFEKMDSVNSIVWLGCAEWTQQHAAQYAIPYHGHHGNNNHFIWRTHAYAIDPPMAKNLLAHVIKMGIYLPVDMMMRTDLFNITHQGFYAREQHFTPGDSVIHNSVERFGQ